MLENDLSLCLRGDLCTDPVVTFLPVVYLNVEVVYQSSRLIEYRQAVIY